VQDSNVTLSTSTPPMTKGSVSTSGTSKILPIILNATSDASTEVKIVLSMKNPIYVSIAAVDLTIEIKQDSNTNTVANFQAQTSNVAFNCNTNCSSCYPLYTTCTGCNLTYMLVGSVCQPIPVEFAVTWTDSKVGKAGTTNYSLQINRDMPINSTIKITLAKTKFVLSGISVTTSNASIILTSISSSRLRVLENDSKGKAGRFLMENNWKIYQDRILTNYLLITVTLGSQILAGNPITFSLGMGNPKEMTV
jgi:hypothetical protein